jgi:hypothetical protein
MPAFVLAAVLVPGAVAGAAEGPAAESAAEGPAAESAAVTVTAASQAAAGELAESLRGIPGFGGLWIGADDRIKVGLVAAEAGSGERVQATEDGGAAAAVPGASAVTVRRLAAGRGLDGATDVVTVRHGLAAIEAGSRWLAAQVERVNRGASRPLLSGPWLAANALELRLPASGALTVEQRELVTSARARLGDLLMIGSYAGRVEANACNLSRCDPPLRGGIRIDSNQPCTLGFLARGRTVGNSYAITAGHCSGTTWSMRTSDGPRRIGDVTARRFSGGRRRGDHPGGEHRLLAPAPLGVRRRLR